VELVDGWRGITVAVEAEPRAEVWRYPVMTVSRSESGFELNYQGTCLLVVVPLVLGKGDSLSFRMTLSIRKGPERPAPSKTSARRRAD
jgi:alpha-amylase